MAGDIARPPRRDTTSYQDRKWKESIVAQLNQLLKVVSATATWDPGSISSGNSTLTTIAVITAAMGDIVLVSHTSDLQGGSLSAYVSAPGIVTAVFTNNTGGAVDLATGTLRVEVLRRN